MTEPSHRNRASVWFWGAVAAATVVFSLQDRSSRRETLQLRTDSLSAAASALLLNRTMLDWTLQSSARESIDRLSSSRRWVFLLIGAPSCNPCAERRESLRLSVRAIPALDSASEIWFATQRPENPRPEPSASATSLLRYLRIASYGALNGSMDTLPIPIALLVDTAGTIRAVSVGFHDGIDARWLEDSRRTLGLPRD